MSVSDEVKYRWDIYFGESDQQKALRLEREGLRLRQDGELDMRYASSRWMHGYRNGKVTDRIMPAI